MEKTRLKRAPEADTRFVADVHLAKLARHLRMLGFDALWRPDFADDELIQISHTDGRVLLTKDRELFERADPKLKHYVLASDPSEQILEILHAFALVNEAREGQGFLTRCLECNTCLIRIPKDLARESVPEDLWSRHEEFLLCPRCERVYWKGSHFDRMKSWVDRLLA